MPRCVHCKTETTQEHYNRIVYGHAALYGPWQGWRLAGRELISPDGDRLSVERLRGMLFREKFRPRPERTECPVFDLGERLPPRERFDGAA